MDWSRSWTDIYDMANKNKNQNYNTKENKHILYQNLEKSINQQLKIIFIVIVKNVATTGRIILSYTKTSQMDIYFCYLIIAVTMWRTR